MLIVYFRFGYLLRLASCESPRFEKKRIIPNNSKEPTKTPLYECSPSFFFNSRLTLSRLIVEVYRLLKLSTFPKVQRRGVRSERDIIFVFCCNMSDLESVLVLLRKPLSFVVDLELRTQLEANSSLRNRMRTSNVRHSHETSRKPNPTRHQPQQLLRRGRMRTLP